MKTIGVIPARYLSTRFEGKVLADLNGKPMIEHVWQRAKEASSLDRVIIACDDERVKQAVENFGGEAIMTAIDHPSGTDRIAEAVADSDADIVVNVQGDEPLLPAVVINDLVKAISSDEQCVMATVIKACDNDKDIDDPNVVKAAIDTNGYALYFSRTAIPYNRENVDVTFYKHFGIYAYRRDFLMQYPKLNKTPNELAEKLEQLRVLEAGYKIKTVITNYESVGVDTPEDLERVSHILLNK